MVAVVVAFVIGVIFYKVLVRNALSVVAARNGQSTFVPLIGIVVSISAAILQLIFILIMNKVSFQLRNNSMGVYMFFYLCLFPHRSIHSLLCFSLTGSCTELRLNMKIASHSRCSSSNVSTSIPLYSTSPLSKERYSLLIQAYQDSS